MYSNDGWKLSIKEEEEKKIKRKGEISKRLCAWNVQASPRDYYFSTKKNKKNEFNLSFSSFPKRGIRHKYKRLNWGKFMLIESSLQNIRHTELISIHVISWYGFGYKYKCTWCYHVCDFNMPCVMRCFQHSFAKWKK